jgi:4-hydroxythreonine-4-phosphate dehydrogenase
MAASSARRSVCGIQALNARRIALTSGEPAGIGPDICLAVAREAFDCELICLGDRQLLAERAAQIGLPVTLLDYQSDVMRPHIPGELTVLHHSLATPSTPGEPTVANAHYVLGLLDRAIEGTLSGEFAAIVTAPVHKGILNDAGIEFRGHTEYLAARTNAPLPIMMLAAGPMRIALATTHLPLKDVSTSITIELLCNTIAVIDRDLRRWGIKAPWIGVCGLNPHAGEGGHLGDEEILTIGPAIEQMRERGVRVTGPLPADTAFVPRQLAQYDVILVMYHDQGLPVIKHAAFERAVNVTLGLPIVRTSVDHGTALDLAGTGNADASNLGSAIRFAIELI